MDTKEKIFNNAKKLIDYLTSLAAQKNIVFRGYGKQSELLPNLIRDKDWRGKEIDLLYNFEKYALQFFSPNNPIDFLSYAQHYGLPTRLIDFTYNPFTALSFALTVQKSSNYSFDDDKNFYYIRYCNINEHIYLNALPYYEQDTFFSSYSFADKCKTIFSVLKRIITGLEEEHDENNVGAQVILNYFSNVYTSTYHRDPKKDMQNFRLFLNETMEKFHNQKILFIDSNQCNARILMQQGLFMFPYSLNKNTHLEIIEKNTNLIKIDKSIRNELLEYLDTIGQNTFRLMPDIQSVCLAIKRKVTEEKN